MCPPRRAASTARHSRLLEPSHSRSRNHHASGRLARAFSTTSISIISKSSITCCGSSTSTATAAGRCSKSAAAPAPISRGSRRAERSSPASISSASADRAGARRTSSSRGCRRDLREADGERLPFADDAFDLVYAHGVVQYTAHPQALVDECRRVLKPGGEAVFQVYNRISWLNALSKLMKVAARARRCAGAAEVQRRRVPRAGCAGFATCASSPSGFR